MYNKAVIQQFEAEGNFVRIISYTERDFKQLHYEVELQAMEGAEWYSHVYPVYGLTAASRQFNELVQQVNTWILDNQEPV